MSLINTLVHRALMICSKNKLQNEVDNISSTMLKNRSPVSCKTSKNLRNWAIRSIRHVFVSCVEIPSLACDSVGVF